MNLTQSGHILSIVFPGGGTGQVALSDIATIDLETIPAMTVDVDMVFIGLENGEFLEVSDEAEGFRDACGWLSDALGIHPPISGRFPIAEGTSQRAYVR